MPTQLEGGIGNPGALSEPNSRLARRDSRTRRSDLRPIRERRGAQTRDRKFPVPDRTVIADYERRERIPVHEDVELRLLGGDVSLQIALHLEKLCRFGFRYQYVSGALRPNFISRAADLRDLRQRLIILPV